MKEKCSILVNSCDTYSDTWDLFFNCLDEQWKKCPFPIYLNTETKKYNLKDLNITCLNADPKLAWGKRLKESLKKIDTEYVLFMLDDFFITEKVDQKEIDQIIKWMDDDQNIAVFSFYRTNTNNIKSNKYPKYELRPQKCEYKLNCQAAIWRREKLISYIRDHESAWDFELLGSIRANRYHEEFYSIIEGEHRPIMYVSGGNIHRGKWVKETVQLAEKYNLDIDFSKRGFCNGDHSFGQTSFNNLFEKIQNRLKYEIKRFRSLR